ncbi:DUF6249 domain-containing protein [Sediminitomix flava]|nr:DUF6249 domain-containing protein [Sediminitomix flava]
MMALFSTVFGLAYLIISTRHKERMAMIERGIDLSAPKKQSSPFLKKLAFLIAGVGAGIFFGGVFAAVTPFEDAACYFSMIMVGGGGSLLAHYHLQEKKNEDSPFDLDL